MISFANAQDSADIRIACSKVLFLINFFDRRFYENLKKNSNGYRKGNRCFLFIKVGAPNVFLKLNYF